jgi:uncharacterized protein YigE (DUF2233 family)
MIPGMLASMFVRQTLLTLCALLFVGAAAAVDCRRHESAGISAIVCRVDARREKLALHLADPQGAAYRGLRELRAALEARGQKLLFAMNGGMFHPDMQPVGLLVIDGDEIAPINRSSGAGNFYLQPNGVFLVDAHGPRVLATHEYRNLTPSLATQSGPMLLSHGVIPDLPAFRATSRSRHVRNGVCVPEGSEVAFVISEAAVTFREFAEYFRDALGCSDALYLDGSISSLYSAAMKREDNRGTLGPMFAVIAVSARDK